MNINTIFLTDNYVRVRTDDIAEDGIDKKEREYIRHAPISNIFVKGYNFCLPNPMLDSFLRNNKGKIAFHLSDEIVHLNRFLFNDSKASFAWLLHNNPDILKICFYLMDMIRMKLSMNWY